MSTTPRLKQSFKRITINSLSDPMNSYGIIVSLAVFRFNKWVSFCLLDQTTNFENSCLNRSCGKKYTSFIHSVTFTSFQEQTFHVQIVRHLKLSLPFETNYREFSPNANFITKIWLMRFYRLFILLLRTWNKNFANAIFG